MPVARWIMCPKNVKATKCMLLHYSIKYITLNLLSTSGVWKKNADCCRFYNWWALSNIMYTLKINVRKLSITITKMQCNFVFEMYPGKFLHSDLFNSMTHGMEIETCYYSIHLYKKLNGTNISQTMKKYTWEKTLVKQLV